MSVPLEFTNKCSRCGRLMNPGTPVDFFKDGAQYVYLHADDCEEVAKAEAVPRFRPRYEIRECSRYTCHHATGVGFAGTAPPRCPRCNSPWLIDDAELEEFA